MFRITFGMGWPPRGHPVKIANSIWAAKLLQTYGNKSVPICVCKFALFILRAARPVRLDNLARQLRPSRRPFPSLGNPRDCKVVVFGGALPGLNASLSILAPFSSPAGCSTLPVSRPPWAMLPRGRPSRPSPLLSALLLFLFLYICIGRSFSGLGKPL